MHLKCTSDFYVTVVSLSQLHICIATRVLILMFGSNLVANEYGSAWSRWI